MSITIDGDLGISGVDGTAASPAIRGNDSNTGISYGTDIVTINTGGVARVTTDASGNVGINNTSPNGKLHVTGGTTNASSLATAYSAAAFTLTPKSTSGYSLAFGSGPGDLPYIQMSAAGVATEGLLLQPYGGNLLVGTTSWNFSNNGTQIAANGRIYNTSNTDWNLELAGSTSARIRFYTSAGGSGTTVGSITVSGSATTYATSSDYRLKENVAPMTGALATVAALKPCTYNWKVDGSAGQGFIAHELQAVVPDCVIGTKDAIDAEGKPQYQGVDTSFLVATLVAAIQEQQATIAAMETRLAALEA